MRFEKDHLHFQTRHAHVDTQTINVDSNNWIENSNIIFFYASISVWVYVCAARFHDMNRNCRDSSIRYTTLLFQKNTTQKKTLRYWYYCQLYYSLHVIIGRIYLLPIKGIWSYINKIPMKDNLFIIVVAFSYHFKFICNILKVWNQFMMNIQIQFLPKIMIERFAF